MANPIMSVDSQNSNITLMDSGSGSEMLRIEKDGFYVRGVKVPQDEKRS